MFRDLGSTQSVVFHYKFLTLAWKSSARYFVVSQVLEKLGKSEETKDEQFEYYVQDLNDQQVT